eukprot:1160601-Pelagomonas_calceolata.AAC.2
MLRTLPAKKVKVYGIVTHDRPAWKGRCHLHTCCVALAHIMLLCALTLVRRYPVPTEAETQGRTDRYIGRVGDSRARFNA